MAKNFPPLLIRYLKMYQDNPSSKIFAPLAESYRKIGLIDEAIEICKEGLNIHPDFTGGKVALARAYFDKKLFLNVRSVLSPVLDEIADNLIAQKLFAEASLQLGHFEDALRSYKLLLFYYPQDEEVAQMVEELETAHYESGGLVKKNTRPEKLRKLIKLQQLLNKVQRAQGLILT